MAQAIKFGEARGQLASVIASREAVLVLGAGASVSSGAPITSDLVQRLGATFPHAEVETDGKLFDVCTAISDTPPYGRSQIIRFVIEQYSGLAPSDSYRQLPRVRWHALFTTNYDDLVEQTYRSPAKYQTLRPIHLSGLKYTIPRENEVFLFYLMGSVRADPNSDDAPIVTWADYLSSVRKRTPMADLLCSILADGRQFIYVGYSFGDFLLERVLDETVQKVGPRSMPYGYAILTDWPANRTNATHKIESRQVIPVEGSFEEFAELVGEVADGGQQEVARRPAKPLSPAQGRTLTIGGEPILLSEEQAAVYSEAFLVPDDSVRDLCAADTDDHAESASAFLRGESLGWLPFACGWAFKRFAYQELYRMVKDRCSLPGSKDNAVILVHGPAGLGKTIMSEQLAYDVYTELGVPVLLAKPSWRARPDLKLVDRFCHDLEAVMPEDKPVPRVTLIVDEAELIDRSVPSRVAAYLRGRGRAVVVVLFARTNEYFRLDKRLTDTGEGLTGQPTEVRFEEKLTPEEVSALIAHIVGLGVWDESRITNEQFWLQHVGEELEYSFFDTLYSLVTQTQQPLRERIWSEYENLGALAKQAYILIAASHQFGLPLKMEMLQRALGVSFDEFEKGVVRSDARDVLFTEHQTSELNLFLRGRTRTISGLVFGRAVPETAAQLEVFKAAISAANPNEMFGVDELDWLRTLLVQVFGSRGFDSRFGADDVAELFETATMIVEDDVLEHHYGLIERDRKRHLSARQHLEKALHLSSLLPFDLATLRESPQNIENSLALVIGELADEALKRNDPDRAEELFQEARQHFLNARFGRFPNAAAYDAHARMLRTRARRLFRLGSADQLLGLSEALDVLGEGIDNVNADERPGLVALRAEILEDLGLEEDAVRTLEERTKSGTQEERSRYHVVLARLYLTRHDGRPKGKHLRKALEHATAACDLDKGYSVAWRLRAEAFCKLHPNDYDKQLQFLTGAVKCSQEGEDNCWVVFRLAVAAFYLEQYDKSVRWFRQLNRISRGHENRTGTLEIAGEDEASGGFEFTGTVAQAQTAKFVIRSPELREFGDVFFNPRTQRYYNARLGDNVSYVVGFNYCGLVAQDLRRI